MKRLFALTALFLVFGTLAAQTVKHPDKYNLSWMTLQDAQLAFEQGRFGEVVRLADNAKQQRKDEVAWSLATLNQALMPVAVRDVGDNIDAVMQILDERNAEDALLIIHEVMVKYPAEKLKHSISNLLSTVALYEEYPEADFMLGKMYVLEGEYTVADSYLTRAWKHADILDIPDQRFDILYQMAYLAKLQKDDGKFEEALLLVIANDGYVTKTGEDGTFMRAVKRSIMRDDMNLDKFFSLYRSTAYTSLSAYLQLADFYRDNGKPEKALTMATLAALISFTRMYEAVQERDMEFKYTKFLDYLKKIGDFYEIADWGAKNGVWEGFFAYAQILYEAGRDKLGEEMLSALSQNCPEDFWRNLAFGELLKSY